MFLQASRLLTEEQPAARQGSRGSNAKCCFLSARRKQHEWETAVGRDSVQAVLMPQTEVEPNEILMSLKIEAQPQTVLSALGSTKGAHAEPCDRQGPLCVTQCPRVTGRV